MRQIIPLLKPIQIRMLKGRGPTQTSYNTLVLSGPVALLIEPSYPVTHLAGL